MANSENPEGKAKMGWLRILLFASLAMNLLVVGLVAGSFVRHDRADRAGERSSPLRDFGYGPYGQALSPTHRREIERDLSGRARDLRQNRETVRAQINTLLDALRQDPFDSDSVYAIISEQQNKISERQEIGRRVLVDRIEAMTAAERAEFADRIEKSMRRKPRK